MCLTPIIIKNPVWKTAKANNSTKRYLAVPCNKCSECLNARRAQWSYRINKEIQYYPDYLTPFVSLDYSPEYVPYDFATNQLVLHKPHLQKFIKAIRNDFPDLKFKYYAIGEYGETFGRPHYHILFFGLPNYIDFSKYWTYGRVDIGEAEPASIHYVAGYFLLVNDFSYKPVKPFSLMSKNIGKTYYDNNKKFFYDAALNNIPVHINNFTTPVPRYYKNLLKKEYDLPSFENQFTPILKGDAFYLYENYKKRLSKKPKLFTNKN